jgi:hypothetical protein
MSKEITKKTKEEELAELETYVFDIDDEPRVHILKCYNNEERPVEKQMKVTIEPLSAKESNRVTKEVYAMTGQQNKMSDAEYQGKFGVNWTLINFKYRVKKIENIYFKIDGKVKEITNPEELYNIKDNKALKIVTEIQSYINDMNENLTETEVKN